MSVGDKRLDAVVDSICNRGCRYVSTILSDEDARAGCRELNTLEQPHRDRVLEELSAVMSVYDRSGTCGI